MCAGPRSATNGSNGKDIWKQSEYPKSLMYERLVGGLAPDKVDQLLDYIMSLSR